MKTQEQERDEDREAWVAFVCAQVHGSPNADMGLNAEDADECVRLMRERFPYTSGRQGLALPK